VNISVKLSALAAQIHPTDPEGAFQQIASRLRPLLLAAKERGVFINFDMESTALKELTLDIFRRLLDEPALVDYPHAGIALQAYPKKFGARSGRLIGWAKSRNRRITIRPHQGRVLGLRNRDGGATELARASFLSKAETDANYERLARRMLENDQFISSAFGTHNVRSIAACMLPCGKAGAAAASL